MNNKKDIFGIVLGVVFVLSGIPKLVGVQGAIDNFNKWGLGDNGRYIVGLTEILLGLLMFVPGLKKYSAFGYFCIMVGGAMTHITVKEYPLLAMPVIFGSVTFYYLMKQDVVKFK
jgi:uncharacterized membrane protein YphA (DoxX/SURF4 family)